MPELNILNLTEDKAYISEEDVVADTSIFINNPTTAITSPPSSQNNATQGSNSVLPINSLSTTQPVDIVTIPGNAGSITNAEAKYEAIGQTATGGSFTPVKQGELPVIYFNFKKNDFYDENLMFRFKTSNLTSTDFTGSTISTWTSDPTVKAGITLTGTNKLKVVKAYDKYFYELSSNSSIENTAINLPVRTNPSYTVFVFGLGMNSIGASDYLNLYNLFNGTNIMHKFVHNYNAYNFNPLTDIINIGKELSGNQATGQSQKYFGSFVGGTLNTQKYLQTNGQYYLKFAYNNPSASFWNSFGSFLGNNVQQDQKYSNFNTFNIRNLRNDIANPTTVQDFQLYTNPSNPATNMQFFSLFFVEMFSYITNEANNGNYLTLNFETVINGQQTFVGKQYLSNTATFDDFNNYLIRLTNKNNNAVANSRMFLFDYLHGTAGSVPLMRSNSKKIIEALCYDYRNLFLKKTTDLQISDGSKSLLFAPKIPHQFLNMYFTSAST